MPDATPTIRLCSGGEILAKAMKRAAASFLSMFLGWLGAFSILGVEKYTGGYEWFDDKGFWLFWPAAFIALSWLGVVLPVLSATKGKKLFSDIRYAWLTWPILAVVTYGVLVLTWMPMWQFVWFPAVVGLVAGISYCLLLKAKIPDLLMFAFPFVVVATYHLVLWPASKRHLTKYVYPLGSLEEQMEMMDYVVKKIKKGMTFETLNSLLPQEFNSPFTNGEGSTKSYDYRIVFEAGRISEVEIKEKQ